MPFARSVEVDGHDCMIRYRPKNSDCVLVIPVGIPGSGLLIQNFLEMIFDFQYTRLLKRRQGEGGKRTTPRRTSE